MTDEKILKKAIEKAVKSGFKYEPYTYNDGVHAVITDIDEIYIYRQIIFNHDFAKAFWGEEYVDDRLGESKNEWIERTGSEKNWGFHKLRYQYHLQQMILEKEPLKYLEKFL